MLYLAFRFKWTFGRVGGVAMFHDVVLVVGVFAWLDKPIDGVFLAAVMTIIGLSVNDSVVVFDRIRERWTGSKGRDFGEVCQRRRAGDDAAHGQHRAGRHVHPRRAGGARR